MGCYNRAARTEAAMPPQFRPTVAEVIAARPRDVVDIKLGPHSVLRVWTVGGMVALTSGKMVERLSSDSREFVGGATVALSFKALEEVSEALARFARDHRKAAPLGA